MWELTIWVDEKIWDHQFVVGEEGEVEVEFWSVIFFRVFNGGGSGHYPLVISHYPLAIRPLSPLIFSSSTFLFNDSDISSATLITDVFS